MHRPVLACALVLVCISLAGCAQEDHDDPGGPTPSASPTADDGVNASVSASTSVTSSPTSTSSAPRASQTFQVDIQGSTFVDGTKTIQKGDTVHWTMKDPGTSHTATSDDGTTFDSGSLVALPTRDQFQFTFSAVGDFPYHCEVHGGMKATITVVESLPS